MPDDDRQDSGHRPARAKPDVRGLPADADEASVPTWWLRAAEHFEAQDLAPYQPPRFEDGTYKHIVEAELEADLGVAITLRCKNGEVGDDWTVLVDGDPAGTVGRHRSQDGYTVYETDPDAFRDLIRSAVADD
ncbi:hypothetical protein [Halorientalis sp.]|jgi:hypothetical protein|uniref:hypothetical protein n=1 Tax=Halorientalis sp. TaxID=1931229 RepID=UPI0026241309|nr:hypothetical protein [Halorientalis sp.]